MQDALEGLKQELAEGGLRYWENEPMSRHTTFLIGGPAALFIEPTCTEQVLQVLRCCRSQGIPLLPVGRGSNLLVADGGLPFAVLHLSESFGAIQRLDKDTLRVQSGAKLSAVCRCAAEQGLSGLETAYGIPGSLGGAVYMNAGAYGGEMKDVVRSVTFADEQGEVCTLSGEALDFRYRHSIFSDRQCVILWADLELSHDDPAAIREAMDEYMERRREKQPLEYGSAGSTFKRPAGAYASALIDKCGLKGFAVGDAQVSQKHAGFVVNIGRASCAEVCAVMDHVVRTVREQTGFTLEPEVKLLP